MPDERVTMKSDLLVQATGCTESHLSYVESLSVQLQSAVNAFVELSHAAREAGFVGCGQQLSQF